MLILNLTNQSNLLMGENLLNHCLVRYTEHSITTQFRMCNHQTLKLQRNQSIYVRKSHETMFRRDIPNLKLSSAFNQSTISLTNLNRSLQQIIKSLQRYQSNYGRKSHNSTNCRDIATIDFTNLSTQHHQFMSQQFIAMFIQIKMKCNAPHSHLWLQSNAYQMLMCQRNWIVIASATMITYRSRSYYYSTTCCQ